MLPDQLNGPLQEDFAALRKLRDDDASGALKEYFGDGEDPREWRGGNVVTVEDGRVTKLGLYKCSSLTALPAAIGELGALTTLILIQCSSLVALPESIGGLDALTGRSGLNGCPKLRSARHISSGRPNQAPPREQTRLLAGKLFRAADADDDAKTD